MKKLLTIAILFCLAAGFAMAQDANEIVAKSKQVTGHEKMEAVKSLILSGTLSVPAQNITLEFKIKQKDSVKTRFEQRLKGKSGFMFTDGNTGYASDPSDSTKLKEISSSKLGQAFAIPEMLIGFITNPFAGLSKDAKFEVSKEKTPDGEMLVVKITDKENEQKVYLDPVSYFTQKYVIEHKDGDQVMIEAFNILDQKKVKGMVVPTFIEHIVDGKTVEEYEYTNFEFDVEIPDTEFKKP